VEKKNPPHRPTFPGPCGPSIIGAGVPLAHAGRAGRLELGALLRTRIPHLRGHPVGRLDRARRPQPQGLRPRRLAARLRALPGRGSKPHRKAAVRLNERLPQERLRCRKRAGRGKGREAQPVCGLGQGGSLEAAQQTPGPYASARGYELCGG